MTKTSFFRYSTLVLLLLNVGLTFFLFSSRKHGGGPPHGKEPRDIIIHQLNLDDAQVVAYDELIREHRSAIYENDRVIRQLKNELYGHLASTDQDATATEQLIREINAVQLQIEHIHYGHFEDIKALCKPDQEQAFNKLAEELAQLFSMHKPHKP